MDRLVARGSVSGMPRLSELMVGVTIGQANSRLAGRSPPVHRFAAYFDVDPRSTIRVLVGGDHRGHSAKEGAAVFICFGECETEYIAMSQSRFTARYPGEPLRHPQIEQMFAPGEDAITVPVLKTRTERL